ncbi:hypothetical protein KCU93_g5794, partial [Aureobasidium melanogenum]
GHSQLKTGHPVRSAIHKQLNGRLVLRWVTTWESLLLYVLLFCLFFKNKYQCGPSSHVLIKVQEDTKIYTFEFPQQELCLISRFFKKAFQGNFLEAATGVLHFTDISAEHFDIFADWFITGQLDRHSLEDMLCLYVLADRLDVPSFRGAITDKLTSDCCFKSGFDVPDTHLITFMMENVPKYLPIHTLLATAVAQVLYHNPEGLDPLPYGFAVRVKHNIDKPYGLCDDCYHHQLSTDDHIIADHCEHFFDEPADHDPERYREAVRATHRY